MIKKLKTDRGKEDIFKEYEKKTYTEIIIMFYFHWRKFQFAVIDCVNSICSDIKQQIKTQDD